MFKNISFLGFITAKTFTTIEYGPTFEITYDNKSDRFKFLVNVPNEQYLDIIFAPAAIEGADVA